MEIQQSHSELVARLLSEEGPSRAFVERIRTARGFSNNEFLKEDARTFILKTWLLLYKECGRANFNIWKEYYNPTFGATLPFCMTQWITFEYMGRLYKELLPAETDRDGFLDAFRWMPSVAGDVVERLRSRAWERRRHLLACW